MCSWVLCARSRPPALTLPVAAPCSTDVNLLADQLVAEEPLISESRRPQLLRLLRTLAEKQSEHDGRCVVGGAARSRMGSATGVDAAS